MENQNKTLFGLIKDIAEKEEIIFYHLPNAYPYDVINCREAAKARKVLLSKEMKHILLRTPNGLTMAHIQAHKSISLRKIKNTLKIKDICMANLKEYEQEIFERGTICPFIEPFWSLFHLLDNRIFENDWMTTNDTTKRGYIIFDPIILKFTENHIIGDFTQEN